MCMMLMIQVDDASADRSQLLQEQNKTFVEKLKWKEQELQVARQIAEDLTVQLAVSSGHFVLMCGLT